MFYSKQYNQYVTEGAAFVLGDVRYPANWLNCSSAEEKEAVGLVEVQVVGSPNNDAYYWVSTTLEDGVLTYVNTPKDLTSVQSQVITSINATAYGLLSPSDWMVTKSIESDVPVDASWTAYRASVRNVANEAKAQVSQATTVDEIAALVINWPKNPNQPIEEQV